MTTIFQLPFLHGLLNIFLYIAIEKVCLVLFLRPRITIKNIVLFFVPLSHWRLKCFHTAAKNVTSARKGSGGGSEGQWRGPEGWGWRPRSTLQYQSSRPASAPQGKSWRCVDSSYTSLQPIDYCMLLHGRYDLEVSDLPVCLKLERSLPRRNNWRRKRRFLRVLQKAEVQKQCFYVLFFQTKVKRVAKLIVSHLLALMSVKEMAKGIIYDDPIKTR